MKRYLISVLALTVIFALLPVSDSAAQLKFEGGVKGGIGIANWTGDDSDDHTSKIGAIGGLFVTIGINEMFAVQVEGLYAQKGAESDYVDSTGTTITEKDKFDYIEIPVLAVVSFAAAEKMNINVFAGPTLGILVSADSGGEDFKDHVKGTDFGAAFGAGFSYAMEAFTILFEGRYTIGFSSVADFSDELLAFWEMTEQPDIKTSNISIMAGFSIPFGGAAE